MTDNFVWYELCTSDLESAKAFYGGLLGWTTTPFPSPTANEYQVFQMDGVGVGGLMALPDGMPKPFWLGYIGVENADAALEQITSQGGQIHRIMDIPDVGKIGLVSDPQGCHSAVIQGYSERKSEAFDRAKPGHGNWHELHSPEPIAGLHYYCSLHGWTKGRTMPLGTIGDYQLFQANGTDIGAMMPLMPGMNPTWIYYFGVPDIDAAAETITANGGTILYGPSEVPDGAWILQSLDPQGAMFAVVGPRVQES